MLWLRRWRSSRVGERQAIEPAHKFATLDGMRGVAAATIVIRHCPALFGRFGFPNSQLAVDLFFLLSGFVLAHAYEQRISGVMGWGEFMRRRAIRLYPLYLLGTFLGIAGMVGATLGHVSVELPPRSILSAAGAAIFMLPWGTIAALYPLDPPAWSLGFELIGNGVYAALLRQRALGLGVLGALVCSCGLLMIATTLWIGDVSGGDRWPVASAGFVRVGFSFFAGVLLYRLPRPSFSVPAWLPCVLLGVALWFQMSGPFNAAYQLIMVLSVFPLLVWSAAGTEPSARARPSFQFCGAVSYGVYILHKPVEDILAGSAVKLHINLSPYTPAAGFIFLVILALVVWLLDKYYDKPIRNMLGAARALKFTRAGYADGQA